MNHENIFDYIRYACHYYVPSKPNKKKIKELIEAIPFFMPVSHQDIFYEIILNNPITSYYDSRDSMSEYGYLLYKEYHIQIGALEKNKPRIRIKDYREYLSELERPYDDSAFKIKRTHHILFFLAVLLLIYYLYKVQ